MAYWESNGQVTDDMLMSLLPSHFLTPLSPPPHVHYRRWSLQISIEQKRP